MRGGMSTVRCNTRGQATTWYELSQNKYAAYCKGEYATSSLACNTLPVVNERAPTLILTPCRYMQMTHKTRTSTTTPPAQDWSPLSHVSLQTSNVEPRRNQRRLWQLMSQTWCV